MSKTKFIAALLFIAALAAPKTSAQAVTISELNVEINADPGQTIQRTVELYDDSLQGVSVYPVVYNFIEDPTLPGTAQVLTDPADLKPDREWVKFDVEKIDLLADGSRVQFPYRIEIPQGGEPGTHLIALVFRTLPPALEGERTAVAIGTNISANIFLKVSGATLDSIKPTLRVGLFTKRDKTLSPTEQEKFFVEKKFFFKPPVDFLVSIQNNGNTHQKPDGNIKIYNDLFGSTADQVSVNRDNKIILPGSTRTFLTDSFGRGFMIGKFRAKLTMIYGNPLRDASSEVEFWIVPVVELCITLGILLLIILLLLVWRKVAKRRREATERKKEEDMRKTLREEIERSIKKGKSSPKKPQQKKNPPQQKPQGPKSDRQPPAAPGKPKTPAQASTGTTGKSATEKALSKKPVTPQAKPGSLATANKPAPQTPLSETVTAQQPKKAASPKPRVQKPSPAQKPMAKAAAFPAASVKPVRPQTTKRPPQVPPATPSRPQSPKTPKKAPAAKPS